MSSTSTTTSVSPSREENFAHNSENANGISLCIPHVFPNISWRRVKQHMIEANLGFVERVDVIRVKDKDYKRAYVHFRKNGWNCLRKTKMRMDLLLRSLNHQPK